MIRCPAGAILALLALPAPAAAETLIAALSAHRVAITSNYTGAQLTVFGLIERDGRSVARPDPHDIVVTVRGPRRMLTVREKERFGPFWINRTQRRFADTAVYLAVASNRPLAEIIDPGNARTERIGLASAQRSLLAADERDAASREFRDALIRIMAARGFYAENGRDVTFLSSALFSAPLPVPATAPTGIYEVEVVLLAGGVVLARQGTSFEVVKSGIEQRLASAAFDWPVLYGAATAAMALLFGWLASIVFRRD